MEYQKCIIPPLSHELHICLPTRTHMSVKIATRLLFLLLMQLCASKYCQTWLFIFNAMLLTGISHVNVK